jgi:hypothetical protein
MEMKIRNVVEDKNRKKEVHSVRGMDMGEMDMGFRKQAMIFTVKPRVQQMACIPREKKRQYEV